MKHPIVSTIVIMLAAAACSGAEPEDRTEQAPPDDNGQQTQTPPESCDGSGSCPACQTCVYDVGGECEGTVYVCLENEQCVALNECMTSCVADDPTRFSDCRGQCNTEHPTGEPDYDAVFECVAAACPTDCRF